MTLDLRKVPIGGWVAGLAGVALLVFSLALPWFAMKGVSYEESLENLEPMIVEAHAQSAFEAFELIDIVLVAVAVGAILLPLLIASSHRFRIPGGPGLVVAALGLVAASLIAFRIISPPDLVAVTQPGGPAIKASEFPDVDVIAKAGCWLGLVAALLIAGGALHAVHKRPPPRGR
jgi:hypothetical protein